MKSERSTPSFEIEQRFQKEGFRSIVGIDEAGRGALAGSLYIGIVQFSEALYDNPPKELLLLRDSKELSAKKRNEALSIIKNHAVFAETFSVSPALIDKLNVNRATFYAIEESLKKYTLDPDCVLLDGTFSFQSDYTIKSVKYGDSLSLTIAAASILAKVSRDAEMLTYAERFPHYGFEKHMGYGTKMHREAIEQFGPTILHRKSYEPVKSMLEE